MMKRLQYLAMIPMAAVLLTVGSCKDPDKDTLEYDRAALTANIGENIILPKYQQLATDAGQLQSDFASFRGQPSLAALQSLKISFEEAWKSWKACSPFEFGPAATRSLRINLNTFPTDSTQIWLNIQSGSWDLAVASNLDAKGFPALDYLLYGTGSIEQAVLDRLAAPADSAKTMAYLADLCGEIDQLATASLNDWQSGYLATFKNSLGTDVGSSTSLLVNELNYDLELIKTNSLGIPLGKQTFGVLLPEKLEGYHSTLSVQLMEAELQSLEDIYQGEPQGAVNGYGLHEALDALEASYNGGSLSAAIDAQFNATQQKISALPSPVQDALLNNLPVVEQAYTEVQKLVVLLKTDLASTMSILITYTDADGD